MNDFEKLLEKLAKRAECVYRDGRHYVPIFVPGAGYTADELFAIRRTLRLITRLARENERLTEENGRLSGRMCLICGAKKPCKETPEACTFDPSPIEAAREFQARAHAAEARATRYAEALRVPEVWSEEERDGMSAAYRKASAKHGHYETLFSVATWLLRYRASTALSAEQKE